MPATLLLPMIFPEPAAVPPIVFAGASTITPTLSYSMTLEITTFPVAVAP